MHGKTDRWPYWPESLAEIFWGMPIQKPSSWSFLPGDVLPNWKNIQHHLLWQHLSVLDIAKLYVLTSSVLLAFNVDNNFYQCLTSQTPDIGHRSEMTIDIVLIKMLWHKNSSKFTTQTMFHHDKNTKFDVNRSRHFWVIWGTCSSKTRSLGAYLALHT